MFDRQFRGGHGVSDFAYRADNPHGGGFCQARTVASDPEAGWIFVADNLTTHVSETLVRYVAKTCGIDDELGVKGKKGILKSVATRRSSLTNRAHRIRFVYVPKHTSWLNQIGIRSRSGSAFWCGA